MLISSDNNKASGAFKCLIDIAIGLQTLFNVDVKVILPRDGDGTELLVKNRISHKIIRSYNWTIGTEDYNKPIKNIQWQIKKLLNRNAINSIAREIQLYKPDIVHINTSWTYVGACASLNTHTPFVWHIREFLEEDQKQRMWDRTFAYSLISKSNEIIAISSSIKDKYENILNRKINLIYDGVDKNQYFHVHREYNHQDVLLLTVGGLYPGKGHEMVINALHKLYLKGYSNFRYTIVGRGSEEEKLITLIHEFNLNDKVKLVGFSSNTETFYKSNDIFIMSSISEAFGRVTVEAMLNGLYVIGYDSAATSELLCKGKYGALYTDVDSLTDYLEKIICKNANIESIAKEGQKYSLENFTSETNVDRIYNLYQKVLLD